jgi:hypothetical protein
MRVDRIGFGRPALGVMSQYLGDDVDGTIGRCDGGLIVHCHREDEIREDLDG